MLCIWTFAPLGDPALVWLYREWSAFPSSALTTESHTVGMISSCELRRDLASMATDTGLRFGIHKCGRIGTFTTLTATQISFTHFACSLSKSDGSGALHFLLPLLRGLGLGAFAKPLSGTGADDARWSPY